MTKGLVSLLSASLMVAAAPAHAKFQSALPRYCDLRAQDLTVDGEPLTYEHAVKLDRRASIAANGTVDLSPVQLPNGREARITMDAKGCARLAGVLGVR